MIKSLSHVSLYVLDQKKAFDVYTQKLGYAVRTDVTMDNGFRWLTISPKDQPELEITVTEVKPEGMFSEESVKHMVALLQNDAMCGGVLEVDDCQATYEELKEKGIEFVSPPKDQFYGIEALFKDGCGNWYSMTQRK